MIQQAWLGCDMNTNDKTHPSPTIIDQFDAKLKGGYHKGSDEQWRKYVVMRCACSSSDPDHSTSQVWYCRSVEQLQWHTSLYDLGQGWRDY
jgi:hypothetical protein